MAYLEHLKRFATHTKMFCEILTSVFVYYTDISQGSVVSECGSERIENITLM